MCPGNSGSFRSGQLPIVVPGAACAVAALRGRPIIRKSAVEAAGAMDAKNASTAPWKTAKNAVSHSYHTPLFFTSITQKVLPMFPVNSVTYLPGCTAR